MRPRRVLLIAVLAPVLAGCGDSETKDERAAVETGPGGTETAPANTTAEKPSRKHGKRGSKHKRAGTEKRSAGGGDESSTGGGTGAIPPELHEPGIAGSADPNGPEPRVGKPKPQPGRTAPATSSGALRFTRIRLFAEAGSGKLAGRANVTNRGKKYLNQLQIGWRLLDGGGAVLDRGTMLWPNLAPGETATVPFRSKRRYSNGWTRVSFSFRH